MRNKLLGLAAIFIASTTMFLLLPHGGERKTTEKLVNADNAADFVYLVTADSNTEALSSRIDLDKVNVNSVIYRWYPKSKENQKVVPIRELYDKERVSVAEVFNSKINPEYAPSFKMLTKTTTLRTNSILGGDKVSPISERIIPKGGIDIEKAKGKNPPKKIKLLIDNGGNLQYIEVDDLGLTTYSQKSEKEITSFFNDNGGVK